jgi:hypothetical protein
MSDSDSKNVEYKLANIVILVALSFVNYLTYQQ